jgi:hypothetical protein
VLARALADALRLPIFVRIAALLPVDQELSADRAALAAVEAQALAGALLKLGDALGPLRDPRLVIGPFGAADARMAQLLGEPVPVDSPFARTALPALLCLSLTPFLCLLPVLALVRLH